MWVTLTENIRALGAEGATVNVPEGYAVNFLFPQHLAFSSKEPKKEETKIKKISADEKREETLASELDGCEVVIAGKVKGEKFTKPISAKEVRAALKEMGIQVPLAYIAMTPIVNPGTYEIPISFSSGYEATINLFAEKIS